MALGEFCNRDVVIVSQTDSIQETVSLMRSKHVGTVVVVEKKDSNVIPVGMVTDRDIVIKVIAENIELAPLTAGDVMSADMVTIQESADLMDAIKLMRIKGIKRIPVVNDLGSLEGILAVDDVLELLAELVSDLAQLSQREQTLEKKRTVS